MSDTAASRPIPDAAASRVKPYRTLRHRDFRLLWGAEFVSTVGTQIQRVGVAWQIFELTGNPFLLGLLGLVRFVPVVAFGMFGGVMADRRDRRRLLLISQSALLVISLVLATLTFTDRISVGAIYALTFVAYACSAVGGPSRQALIPSLIPEREIAGAYAMNTLSHQVAAVSGPAIGGLIIGLVGVGATYLVDASSFLAVIGALLAMKARPLVPTTVAGGWTLLVEGLRFVRTTPILLGVMLLDFVATLFGATTTLMPIFAEEVLDVGPTGYGVLLAAPAAGAVLGSVVISIRHAPSRPGVGLLITVAVYGVAVFGFGLSEWFPLSLAFLALSGAADAVSMACRLTIRTMVTPDPLRGRIAAVHSTFAMGGPQLGEFQAGLVASLVGVGPGVAAGGFMTILLAGFAAKRVPAIGRYRLD